MFENPRWGRQARNFTTNAPKILDLKSSSEQIFSRKLPLAAPEILFNHTLTVTLLSLGLGWIGARSSDHLVVFLRRASKRPCRGDSTVEIQAYLSPRMYRLASVQLYQFVLSTDTSLTRKPRVGPCSCSVIFFESLFKADTSLKRTPMLILIVLHSYSLTLETEISLKQTSSLTPSPELSIQERADCIFLSCVANSSRKPLDPTRNCPLYWQIETGQSEAGTGPSPMPI